MKINNNMIAIGNWIVNENEKGYTGGDSKLSSSRYYQSIRKLILTERYKDQFVDDASNMFKMSLGSLIHEQVLTSLERVYPDQLMIENRINVEHRGYALSGQPDLYVLKDVPEIGLHEGDLVDIKTVNVGTWLYDDDNFAKYQEQLNFLRFLLTKEGRHVNRMFLLFFFTDWTSYQKANAERRGNKYPDPAELFQVPINLEFDLELDKKLDELELYADAHDEDLPECGRWDTWEKPPWKVYKLKKDGKPYASCMAGGSFHSKAEADQFASSVSESTLVVYKRELDRKGCQSCLCRHWCDLYKMDNSKAFEGGAPESIHDLDMD